ncbi:DNA-directed RNA polymerase sigma-70 factor [Actinoplanes lobatus]|uniref:DNA-directed RNA polymerase sigma-70 factor n=1 Tax=Actinoplanes lobatus TaxID=113568 RepID=A0A7W7HPI1_9ACTN|nr:sigma-70 family RNA polymerase sigma factor [Actinoplanes lobatus]MBB4754317.1 RNA polymerase sigma-70 factor (ECF subfamily) [Actinoplanes lobatus]GGN62454.1 DNA-directed RNA polymerase sigma-70 factor [Actinoplanes lobatus]GIE45123.1 DNA-directed RNA polymerase sigma-70 factor [Actinoplanes lobatus]
MSAAEQRFTAMMSGHGPAVLGYLSRRTEPAQDAADLMAEVFVVAWRRLAEVPAAPDETRAWLIGAARLVLANHRRGTVRRHRLANRLRLHLRPEPAPDPATDLVRDALARLGDDDRELLTLIGWEDLTATQAAAVLGITPAAVRKRLERARSRLREQLEPSPAPR